MRKILLLLRSENTSKENSNYVKAINQFGGEVICLLDSATKEEAANKMKDVFGILLPGGSEVGRLDFFIIEYALKNNIRLFGICQGMQSMALYNTNNKLVEIGNMSHQQKDRYIHKVFLEKSHFRDIVGRNVIEVNSHHIQTVLDSRMFNIVGKSEDGLIEVIENSHHVFQIGVQWHPELMLDYDGTSRILFEAFFKE